MQELGWDRLKTRRQLHKLSLYHRFNNAQHQTPRYIRSIMPNTRAQLTGRVLRNANAHTIQPNRTRSYKYSFFPSTGKHWNQLPQSLRSLPHASFKRAITKRLGVSKPPIYHKVGSKEGNILHTRIRIGMSSLNSHFFQINRSPTPECSCGHSVEDVFHFILFCTNYLTQRQILYHNISQILGTNFNDLTPPDKLRLLVHGESLDSGEGRRVAHHFQIFLLNSHRFRND